MPSQASSRTQTTSISGAGGRDSGFGLGSGNYDNQTTDTRRPSWIGGDEKEEYDSSSEPGSALSSASASSLLLVKAKDEGVSVSKLSGYPSAPPYPPGPGDPTTHAPWPPSEVSANITPINASPRPGVPGEPPSPVSPASSATAHPRPLSRRRNFVTIHSDKTFSLVRLGPHPHSHSQVPSQTHSDVSSSVISPGPSATYSSRTSSSHERPSIDAWSEALSNSPTDTTATITDNSHSELVPFFPSPGPSSKHLTEDLITSSPWNYRMVGGLRKVPKTPDLKNKKSSTTTITPGQLPVPLAPLPEITVCRDEDDQDSRTVVPKASFASVDSAQTISTSSETTNYKVYGASSSPQPSIDSLPLLPSSSNPNYEILGESSPAPFSSSPPGTSDGNDNFVLHGDPSPSSSSNYVLHGDPSPTSSSNYVLHGDPSPPSTSNYVLHGDPSPSSSLATVPRKPRPTYSQESLVVPPLRPARKKSHEKIGYYKQRSRENLRARAGSLQSLKSISSIISNQDPAQAFLVAPILINFGASSSRDARAGFSGTTSQQQSPWLAPPAPGSSTDSSTTPSAITQRPVPMIQEHPHQWSSQLSTVMSESDAESEHSPSRSGSASLSVGGNGHRRRSSAGWAGSMHSRQLQSISSSLAQLEESNSGSESPDRPQPTFARAGTFQTRQVRDQDEHGDGLADLQAQPSRSGLSAFFMSSNSSSRNLHSSASSRSNSFNSASIPAWAKVYYGSGERKFLGAPSIGGSDIGENNGPSSAGMYNSTSSNSPNSDHCPMAIYSQRKRAREVHPHPSQRPFSDAASLDIAPAPPMGDYNVFRSLKRKTSSIWSPHLRQDRRASRYSVWDPPSVSWSADSGILGKRNAQVVLFILGFIFPFGKFRSIFWCNFYMLTDHSSQPG